MNREYFRLQSFKHWKNKYVDKKELAISGFFFTSVDDLVYCYFCHVELWNFKKNDNVIQEHIRWSPFCKLLCHEETNNIPINSEILSSKLPPKRSHDEKG